MNDETPETVAHRVGPANLQSAICNPQSAILLCCLVFTGCGERLPETVPVSGSVTWQGKPLTSGRVVFHPQEIAEGLPRRPATGDLDQQGRFKLTTFRGGDGAVPGDYRVCVFSYLSDQTAAEDDVSIPETVWRIPERYGDPRQSGLSATIPAGSQPLSFDFDLTDVPFSKAEP